MKLRSLTLMLALLCLLCPIFLACAEETPQYGEFVPPPFDAAAVVGTPTVPEELGWRELDVKGVYKVSVCGVLKPSGKTLDIWFTSPESNTVWLKVRLIDAEGNTLGESGLIRPGEYVQSITLDSVPETDSAVVLKVMGYMPDTYYSAGEAELKTKIYA